MRRDKNPWVEEYFGYCDSTGKRKYATATAAREAKRRTRAGRSKQGSMGTLNVYECDCGFWHCGHATAVVKAAFRSK